MADVIDNATLFEYDVRGRVVGVVTGKEFDVWAWFDGTHGGYGDYDPGCDPDLDDACEFWQRPDLPHTTFAYVVSGRV